MEQHRFNHAKQRARERFRVELMPEELERMSVEIEQGRSTFVKPAWGGREIHLVHCPKANHYIPVVYDPHARDRIVTVLPEEGKHFGIKAVRREKRFRETDFADEVPDEAEGIEPALGEPPPPNNILAAALETALRDAGLLPPFPQSSPSDETLTASD